MQPHNIGNMSQNAINPMVIGQMQNCINDCLNCHKVCMDQAMITLATGKPEHVKVLLDCTEICLATAHAMMRSSSLHGYFCNACQAVCTHCANMCDTIGDQDCANACRSCATACQQLIKMAS
jgi:hypothetical protein